MKIPDLIIRPRETRASYHLQVAAAWREFGEHKLIHSALAYAAFELRCAIERVLFELYFLMKELGLAKEDANSIKSFGSLVSLVCDEAGGTQKHLYRALIFNSIYVEEQLEASKPAAQPETGKLQRMWNDLSKYCHRQLDPNATWDSNSWVQNGYKTIGEVEKYLHNILIDNLFAWIKKDSMPIEAQDLREKFINEAINEKSLRIRLRIIKPIIEMRPK